MEAAQRASSEPPGMSVAAQATYLRNEHYSADLVERASQLQFLTEDEERKSAQAPAVDLTNVHSSLHGSDDADCDVGLRPCHGASLNQKQRKLVRALSAADILAILLPHLHDRAAQSKSLEEKVGWLQTTKHHPE